MIFDIDADWPAPGFQLGFGKIVLFDNHASPPTRKIVSMLIEPDGTRHPTSLQSRTNLDGGGEEFSWRTTDGSLIDYIVQTKSNVGLSSNRRIVYAEAKYPNGMVVEYTAASRQDPERLIFPSRIIDVNGNVITINYRETITSANFHVPHQPKIGSIEDTVGRLVQFHYDTAQRLTAITAPGYQGGSRTLARFHYAQIDLNLKNAFAASLRPNARNCKSPAPGQQRQPCLVQVIDAVYYPGTSTGYQFGYSSYGMATKVSERRAMGLVAGSLNEQGTVTPGLMTRERVYDYPLTPSSLAGAPTYSKMTETWAGMNEAAPVTKYETDPANRTSTVTMPNGTRIVRTAYKRPGQIEDGLPFQEETFDTDQRKLVSTTMVWEQGDYNSPRIKRVETTDELGQIKATEYEYGAWHNQVKTMRELDYGGNRILRTTQTAYNTDWRYDLTRHIFNLPTVVEVFAGDPSIATIESRTEVKYDSQPLLSAPTLSGRDDPNRRYDPAVAKMRGLVTEIRTYPDAAHPGPSTAHLEKRVYDETGNLVQISNSSCCDLETFVFEPSTQYAWPSRVIRGSDTPNSPVRVEDSFGYDINTGSWSRSPMLTA